MEFESGLAAVRHVGIRSGKIAWSLPASSISMRTARQTKAPRMMNKGRIRAVAEAGFKVFEPDQILDTAAVDQGLSFPASIDHLFVDDVAGRQSNRKRLCGQGGRGQLRKALRMVAGARRAAGPLNSDRRDIGDRHHAGIEHAFDDGNERRDLLRAVDDDDDDRLIAMQ